MSYLYHVTKSSNLESILKSGLIPSVGKRSEKLAENPCIFLFPDKHSAEDALANWLGDEFEEELADEEEIVILKIAEKSVNAQSSTVDWEVCVFERIPPNAISEILDDSMSPLDHPWNRRKKPGQDCGFSI